MKEFNRVLAIVLGMLVLTAPHGVATSGASTVTGAVEGPFGAGAAIGPVMLDALEAGTGVLVEPDGSAVGVFHAVLRGHSLGQPQDITIDGSVNQGSVAGDGSTTFSGTATVDLGGGIPPLTGVWFSVTAADGSMTLVVDSTVLPVVELTAGVLVVD